MNRYWQALSFEADEQAAREFERNVNELAGRLGLRVLDSRFNLIPIPESCEDKDAVADIPASNQDITRGPREAAWLRDAPTTRTAKPR